MSKESPSPRPWKCLCGPEFGHKTAQGCAEAMHNIYGTNEWFERQLKIRAALGVEKKG